MIDYNLELLTFFNNRFCIYSVLYSFDDVIETFQRKTGYSISSATFSSTIEI